MYLPADICKTIARIPWFMDLNPLSQERLASIATLQELEPGDMLFKEGDQQDLLYILLEGQVVLEIEVPTQGQILIFTAETLDIIGWSSMTSIVRQRTTSARATQRSLLLGFQSEILQQLCEEDHDLGYVIMRRLSNVVASRLLTTRVYLMDMIAHTAAHEAGAV